MKKLIEWLLSLKSMLLLIYLPKKWLRVTRKIATSNKLVEFLSLHIYLFDSLFYIHSFIRFFFNSTVSIWLLIRMSEKKIPANNKNEVGVPTESCNAVEFLLGF